MQIDMDLFEREMNCLVDNLECGIRFGINGEYDKAIGCFTYAIVSAGIVLKRDPETGREFRLDKTILVAKGLQLKAYAEKLRTEPGNRIKIIRQMAEIAKGRIAYDNAYFADIMMALREWNETAEKGDFYSRPRDD